MTTNFADIAFNPLLPAPLLYLLLALIVLMAGLSFWRRAPATSWRVMTLLAAFLVLLNPSLVSEQREPLKDVTLVIVDQSDSQTLGERRKRSADAVAAIEAKMGKRPDMDLRIIESRAKAPLGQDDGTHLISALNQSLGDVPQDRLAGVVLVTDGQVHDVPAEIGSFLPNAPLHVLLTGEKKERDRRLEITRAPSYGIVGSEQILAIKIHDNGEQDGSRVRLKVQLDGEIIYNRSAPINQQWLVPFILSHGGEGILEVDVEPAAEELSLRNNRSVLTVNGVRDRLRVLLISGEPHAGERTWRNILKSDPAVDLVHFTILRPPSKHDGTPIRELSLISFPTRQLFHQRLKDFDLVIFDRYRRRGVLPDTYLKNVVQYVQNGGAVLTSAGPSFANRLSLFQTPLRAVLPASPTGEILTGAFLPRLTDTGRRHPVTANLEGALVDPPAWGPWLRMIDANAQSGDVVMRGQSDRPLLVLQRYGEGRVAQLLSDHVWLWARGYKGGGPQIDLLRRTAHWLMKEPELEEDDLRAQEVNGRLRISRRSLEPSNLPVTVTAPSGKEQQTTLKFQSGGAEISEIDTDEVGIYRISDGQRKAIAAVGEANSREFTSLRTTATILGPLASASQGGVFWLADGMPEARRIKAGQDAFGRQWFGLYAHGRYIVAGIERTPLLPGWLAVIVIIGLLMLAWRFEGR
jgi:hypothetical protein